PFRIGDCAVCSPERTTPAQPFVTYFSDAGLVPETVFDPTPFGHRSRQVLFHFLVTTPLHVEDILLVHHSPSLSFTMHAARRIAVSGSSDSHPRMSQPPAPYRSGHPASTFPGPINSGTHQSSGISSGSARE